MTHYLKSSRKKKTKSDKSFPKEVVEAIYRRDKGACTICGSCINLEAHPHHVFYRSELYRDIINWKENGVTICTRCHASITNKTPDNGGKEMDKQLKRQSIKWFKKNKNTTDEDIKTLTALYRARYGRL